jgi:hypothetical protein
VTSCICIFLLTSQSMQQSACSQQHGYPDVMQQSPCTPCNVLIRFLLYVIVQMTTIGLNTVGKLTVRGSKGRYFYDRNQPTIHPRTANETVMEMVSPM